MKRSTNLILICTILVFAVVSVFAGEPCGPQEYPSWDPTPMTVDPNMIAIHPISGQRLFLGWIITTVGQPWTYVGSACDPDGDSMTYTVDTGTITDNGATYSVNGPALIDIGLHYVNVSVTDEPLDSAQAVTVTGTLVVVNVPPNRPPVLLILAGS